MKIGVIGAGYAGTAAAQAAAQAGAEVTLFSDEKTLPYFRPRLPAVAFSEITPEEAVMKPARWYAENKIDLRLDQPISAFSTDGGVTLKNGGGEWFDALVLTTGAGPIFPAFARGVSPRVTPLWTMTHAETIRSLLRSGHKIAVIGGGVIGVETALRARSAGLEVWVIEKLPALMRANFGPTAASVIRKNLEARGVRVMTNIAADRVEAVGENAVRLTLGNGEVLELDGVVLSLGACFDLSMATAAGLSTDRGVSANHYLRSSARGVFVAGDIAQLATAMPCSAKEALLKGRIAGHNAVMSLTGGEMLTYEQKPVSMTLKYKDFELYAIGAAPGPGLDEKILELMEDRVYRAVVSRGGKTAGAQMVGSGQDFKQIEKAVLAGE